MLLSGGGMVGAYFIITCFSEWSICCTHIWAYGVLACGIFFIVGFWFIWEVWNIFSPSFNVSGLNEYFGFCHILALWHFCARAEFSFKAAGRTCITSALAPLIAATLIFAGSIVFATNTPPHPWANFVMLKRGLYSLSILLRRENWFLLDLVGGYYAGF